MENQDSKELANIRPVTYYTGFDRNGAGPAGGITQQYAPQENQVEDYIRIVFKYRYLIAICTGAAFVLAVLYCLLATPLYTAESSLKIGTYQPVIPGADIERSYYLQSNEQDYFNTQTEILTSLTLADKVLSEADQDKTIEAYLKRRSGFFSIFSTFLSVFSGGGKEDKAIEAGAYNNAAGLLRGYLGLVKITPVRKTSIVRVSVTTADAALSAKIANAHASSFIDLVRSQRQQSAVEQLVFLKRQAEELAERVAFSERNLASYAEDNSIVALNENENITVKRMAELNQLLTEATAKRIKSESHYLEAKDGSGLKSTLNDDESIRQMRVALDQAKSEYAMLSEKFQPVYPKMIQLKARIDSLQMDLSRQRSQALGSLEATYKADVNAEEELKNQLEIQKSKVFELSRREAQYNILKREYESLKDLHQTVLRQMKQTQMNSESVASNVSPVDQAAIPFGPSSPRKLLTVLIAMFIGPSVGFGLGLIKELLDNTIETPEDVARILHLPSLGVVPSFTIEDEKAAAVPVLELTSEDQVGGDSGSNLPIAQQIDHMPVASTREQRDLITLDSPTAVASEAYRTIRTSILLSSADKLPRVIMITSAKKGEGKTTLSTNLAVTLAQAWKRTVIVSADLRRPVVRNFFAADSNCPGLVDYLTGQRNLEDVVFETPVPNLYMISGGAIPPNPAELLGSKKMANMIQLLTKTFDYVIIDASPILPVADPLILSQVSDGVVVVVRAHETEKHIAKEATNRLRQVGAKILGVVLNDVDVTGGSYYYYYRDAYSEYYGEDKPRRRRRTRHHEPVPPPM